jgi:hypothetical protein
MGKKSRAWIQDPGANFEKGSLSYGENLEDLRLADWNIQEICDVQNSHKKSWIFFFQTGTIRNLRICDFEMSPRMCGFAICVCLQLYKLTRKWGGGGWGVGGGYGYYASNLTSKGVAKTI